MKRTVGILAMALALCCALVAGCASTGGSASSGSASASPSASGASASTTAAAPYKVVCTTFPAYDWVKQVVGDQADNFQITYLLGNGSDMHSFQPTFQDIASISSCDLFVYVGGESDQWVDDMLAEAANKNLRTVNLLETIGSAAVEEEVVEGMQADEDAEEEEGALDEHVWLSLRNAQVLVSALANALGTVDTEHAAIFTDNATRYNDQLAALDARYQQAVDAAGQKTLVFADRFPFRYLTRDYGLSYYAAFVGCSAETEASFETITFLAKKVDELGVGTVLVIETSDGRLAQTVVNATAGKSAKILTMNSLQATTQAQADAGTTYLSVMEDNLDILTQALA